MKIFRLPQELANIIMAQAQQSPLHEICGLIGGQTGHAGYAYPINNIANDRTRRYQMDPREQINAMRQMRDRDEELIAIYHSHPYGPAIPSAIDIAEAEYPDVAYLIVSLTTKGVLDMTAHTIKNKQAREITLELI